MPTRYYHLKAVVTALVAVLLFHQEQIGALAHAHTGPVGRSMDFEESHHQVHRSANGYAAAVSCKPQPPPATQQQASSCTGPNGILLNACQVYELPSDNKCAAAGCESMSVWCAGIMMESQCVRDPVF